MKIIGLSLQIGRGKESWGSGNDIELALSEEAKIMIIFFLASDYGKVRVRYIHGFLENVKQILIVILLLVDLNGPIKDH